MAVTASGLFYPTFSGMLKNTIALDLTAATHKVALIDNTATPDFDAHDLWADLSADEVSGTGWAAGGVLLDTPAITVSPAGTLKYDAVDVSETSVTVVDARAAVIYADGLADELVVLVDFEDDYSATAGTFEIQWNTTGIFTIDLTPA